MNDEKVSLTLHELKLIASKFNELDEYLKFATKELNTIRSFLHGKITLEDIE